MVFFVFVCLCLVCCGLLCFCCFCIVRSQTFVRLCGVGVYCFVLCVCGYEKLLIVLYRHVY